MPRNQIGQTEAANLLIEHLMRQVIGQTSGATRARLARIRYGNGGGATASDPDATGLPRYDVTNGVALRGWAVGATSCDLPLSDWTDFLPAMLADECTMQRLPQAGVAALRSRLPSSRLTTTLVCPAAGWSGQMTGALFILWDGSDRPPVDEGLRHLITAARRVATQIARVLDLCDPSLDLPPITADRHLEAA